MTSAITVQAGNRRLELLGEPAPEATAQRAIAITPDTRFVNVEGGEIVKFVVGDKSFTWNFNGPATTKLELDRVAPSGVLKQKVIADVAPDPKYLPY